MLQNWIDLSTVDVSYVSSHSWYFLNLFGLRGLFQCRSWYFRIPLDVPLSSSHELSSSSMSSKSLGGALSEVQHSHDAAIIFDALYATNNKEMEPTTTTSHVSNMVTSSQVWHTLSVTLYVWPSIYEESRISMQISFRAFHLIIMISLSFGGLICFVSKTEYYSGKDKDTSLDGNLGREPINAWFTAQLGILDSVRVYFLYVSGKKEIIESATTSEIIIGVSVVCQNNDVLSS
ncbi:hypothetical protein P8452_46596 [Trifolium repens]|nr:hypothetical protein P8452_46596 [Trifolium repens]